MHSKPRPTGRVERITGMTKEYATKMWKNYLHYIKDPNKNRIIPNPAIALNEDAKNGYYDSMSDDCFDILLEDVKEESEFFGNKSMASAYVVFIRAYQSIEIREDIINAIAEILAQAMVEENEFKNMFEDLPFI